MLTKWPPAWTPDPNDPASLKSCADAPAGSAAASTTKMAVRSAARMAPCTERASIETVAAAGHRLGQALRPVGQGVQPSAARETVRARRPHRDIARLSLQGDRTTLAELDLAAGEQAARGLGQQDRVARIARRALNARGDVDRVADDRELEPATAADRTGDHRSGVDADADPQLAAVALLDRVGDLARGLERAIGVVGQVLGGAEDAHHSVADELVRVAAVPGDDGDDAAEEVVQACDRLARARVLGERREVANVDEQHGDLGLLGLERLALGQHAPRDLGVDVAAERRLQPL